MLRLKKKQKKRPLGLDLDNHVLDVLAQLDTLFNFLSTSTMAMDELSLQLDMLSTMCDEPKSGTCAMQSAALLC